MHAPAQIAKKNWALERLADLEKTYADCTACGECMERCPYDLPLPDLMARAAMQMCGP
ncbi:MAG: 4Fe-4S dicluster domain-containing protein [Myxococcota bacterium]|nr:4Fe-4S dicluster domain-containing protein [Myxococcota bacterium]